MTSVKTPMTSVITSVKTQTDIPPVKNQTTKFYKAERNAVILLAGIFSLRMLAVFMILPIFALFAKTLPGATPSRVGLALGIYGLIQALLQAPLGYISDRFGRKPVIALGLFIFAIGSMVAAMSHSITGIILGRSLQGAGAIGSVIMALLTDLTREQVRSKAMAIVGISIGASFALAFVLGPLLDAWIGVPGMFWLMAIFSFCAIVLVYGCMPSVPSLSSSASLDRSVPSSSSSESLDRSVPPSSSSASLDRSVPPFVKGGLGGISEISKAIFGRISTAPVSSILHPNLLPIYFAVLVIHAALMAIFLKLPLALSATIPTTHNQTLWFYLPIFLASAISTFPCLTRIEKTRNYHSALLACLSILLLSFLLIFFVMSFGMYFGLQTTLSLGFGLGLGLYLFFIIFNILEASLPSYLSKQVSQTYKGTALGIFSSLQFLGLCLGGVLGGWLDEHFGTLAVFAFCVILTLILLVWLWIGFFNNKLKRFIWHVA